MIKLRILKARELEKLLFNLEFQKIRQRGSHVFYKHEDGRSTTIPHHKGVALARPLNGSILRDIHLDLTTFNKYLDEL